jgi:hypothetical protein
MAVKFDFNDTVSVAETFSLGMRYHRFNFHNGMYKRDGSINHNTFKLIPLE